MPAIHITESQATALARGENITIAPERHELHNVVVVATDGAPGANARMVYVYDGERAPSGSILATRWQRLTDIHGRPAQRIGRNCTRPVVVLAAARKGVVIQVGA